MINYTYKFRIYPNDEQIIQLSKTFGCVRKVYNYYLDNSKDNNYQSKVTNNNHCNQILKKDLPYLKEVDKFAITNSIYNLDTAFKSFFKNNYGYPKFKSKRSVQSFKTNYTNNNNIEVLDSFIKLLKLEKAKAKIHRKIEENIINTTIKKYPSDKYYVCILVNKEMDVKKEANQIIGIDMGLTHFVTDNQGNKIKDPKALAYLEKKLIKEQPILSFKTKGSNNYYKQRTKLARIHEKINNIRNNFLEQLSTSIINENQIIIVEDLSIKEMIEGSNLAKRLSDVSISTFISKLEYKSKWYGRLFIKVNKYYASSQLCSFCGEKNVSVKDVSVRMWECPNCHFTHDRDINAAQNILQKGISTLFA